MASYLWPGDSGWPTPDGAEGLTAEEPDPDGEIDFDALCLHAAIPHLFDALTDLERTVLGARFGLDRHPTRSMKQLHADLGLTRHEVRNALESGLAKLRRRLTA